MRAPHIVITAAGVPMAFPVGTTLEEITEAAKGHAAQMRELMTVAYDEHGTRRLLLQVSADGTVTDLRVGSPARWTYSPRPQSRTRRTELRRDVRRLLGTAGDGAPSTRRTLQAAKELSELVYLATDGRLSLKVRDERTGMLVDFLTAIGSADVDATN